MQLVSLKINVTGNPLGENVEIVIDHAPGSTKTRYFSTTRTMDGSVFLQDVPRNITSDELQQASTLADGILQEAIHIINQFGKES